MSQGVHNAVARASDTYSRWSPPILTVAWVVLFFVRARIVTIAAEKDPRTAPPERAATDALEGVPVTYCGRLVFIIAYSMQDEIAVVREEI